MDELILHHFDASPFSEKVRLVLGYKQLEWKSVLVPSVMPKPDVIALTGGYRRTPFLQIGADVYCDAALICDVLESLKPLPSLYPSGSQSLARILAQWADSTLFWSAVTFNRGPKGVAYQLGNGPGSLPSSIYADRKAMGFDVDWVQPGDAAPAYLTYLQRLTDLLAGQTYLMGTVPCIADFSAFHPLWLVHVRAPGALDVLQRFPAVNDWSERMRAIGHSRSFALDSVQAIAHAAKAEPAGPGKNLLPESPQLDEHGFAVGSQVRIMAESFGKEPTHGELIAATATHYSLRRDDPRAGRVHVHFPRIGYVLKRDET